MQKKNVLFLINAFVIGGAERVFIAQANELYARGWDVRVATLFSAGPLIRDLQLPKERIHDLAARSLFDLSALLKLKRIIKAAQIDIVYTTLNEANTFGRFLKVLAPKIRLYTRESNMADVKPTLYKAIDILFGPLSQRIIAVSGAVKDSLGYAPWLKKRTVVLYNGVRLDDQSNTRPPDGFIRLVSVGSLTPKKDHSILIDALSLLPEKFRLTIAGSGALHSALQQQISSLGLQNRANLLGAVPSERVVDLYRTHDVFVLPSTREGCPNVVSEAQSFSLPVVAFDIPGMCEFVDESSGILVKKRGAKELAQALEDCVVEGTREKLGRGGYEKVSRERDYNHQLDALISLFESAR